MTLVRISADVSNELLGIAHARNDPKERFNEHSPWRREMDARGKATSLENHHMGLIGEWAAGQVLGGLDIDRTINEGDQDVGDLLLPDGSYAQVKTRNRYGWDYALGSPNISEFKAKVGVLVWPFQGTLLGAIRSGRDFHVAVHGWIPRRYFIRHFQTADFGYGPRLICSPRYFLPIQRWLTLDYIKEVLCQSHHTVPPTFA